MPKLLLTRSAALLCFLMVAGISTVDRSHANPAAPDSARMLFDKAEAAFAQGNFQDAFVLYSRAHKARALPGFLFNMGLCQRNLGRHAQALSLFRRYLKQRPQAHNRAITSRLIVEAERALRVHPSAKAEANAKTTRRTRIAPPRGRRASVAGALQRPMAEDKTHQRQRSKGIWLWSGAGLTASLLVVATLTGQLASNRSSEYRDPQTPASKLGDLRDSGRGLARASAITFAAAGAAGLATFLHYWFGYRESKAVDIALNPSPTGGTVLLTWTR